MKKTIVTISTIIILGVIASCISIYNYFNAEYKSESKWIYIQAKASDDDIKSVLVDSLGSIGLRAYQMWSFANGNAKVAHGAYKIRAGESAIDIGRRIKQGAQTPVTITFNNIRTIEQLAERISLNMTFDEKDFFKACDSILSDDGLSKHTYISAFLPDSYEFYWTVSADNLVRRLYEYQKRFWNKERLSKAKSLGITPLQATIIASIAEEETNRSDERGIVARLYLNRLERGMLLQADPTIKFALGDFSLKRILNKHLAVDSRYNTYMYAGLPPGPIRMPEGRTIDALLNSKPHPYLYMCAKEDFSGKHNFAIDLATHQRNATRYQAALNRRKIK